MKRAKTEKTKTKTGDNTRDSYITYVSFAHRPKYIERETHLWTAVGDSKLWAILAHFTTKWRTCEWTLFPFSLLDHRFRCFLPTTVVLLFSSRFSLPSQPRMCGSISKAFQVRKHTLHSDFIAKEKQCVGDSNVSKEKPKNFAQETETFIPPHPSPYSGGIQCHPVCIKCSFMETCSDVFWEV